MRTRLSICRKKARYPTEAEALVFAERVPFLLHPYHCDRCDQFHLTSRTKGRRVVKPVGQLLATPPTPPHQSSNPLPTTVPTLMSDAPPPRSCAAPDGCGLRELLV